MHRIRLGVLAVCIFGILFTGKVCAQDQNATRIYDLSRNWNPTVSPIAQRRPPVRDAAALSQLQRSVAAMGGDSVASTIRTLVVAGSGEEEGKQVQFVWKDLFQGKRHELRRELLKDGTRHVLISGHGKPASTDLSKDQRLYRHVIVASPALHAPVIVLAQIISDADWSIETVESKDPSLLHIRTGHRNNLAEEALTSVDWYINTSTVLPVRAEYHVPQLKNALKFRLASLSYDDFRAVSGAVLPFRIVAHSAAGNVSVYNVEAAETNVVLSDSDFDDVRGMQ